MRDNSICLLLSDVSDVLLQYITKVRVQNDEYQIFFFLVHIYTKNVLSNMLDNTVHSRSPTLLSIAMLCVIRFLFCNIFSIMFLHFTAGKNNV